MSLMDAWDDWVALKLYEFFGIEVPFSAIKEKTDGTLERIRQKYKDFAVEELQRKLSQSIKLEDEEMAYEISLYLSHCL